MFISLIIPVYKVRDFISECLSSIEGQSLDKKYYEVIVVNDGTPDDSMEIATPIINRMGNVKVINQHNQGLSIARNNGLELATGDYVWFVDSDDWLLPNALQELMRNIKIEPHADVFSSRLEMHFDNGHKTKLDFNPTTYNLSGKEYLKQRYKQGAVQRFIFKRDFLISNKLSFYPGILHEDGLFGYMMLYLAKRIKIIETPIYAYRIRCTGSIMSSVSMRTPYDMLFIHKELRRFMDEIVIEEDKTWFQFSIAYIIRDLFQFSRSIVTTPDFMEFYQNNRNYLQRETKVFLHSKKTLLMGIYLTWFPIRWYATRQIIKRLLRK